MSSGTTVWRIYQEWPSDILRVPGYLQLIVSVDYTVIYNW